MATTTTLKIRQGEDAQPVNTTAKAMAVATDVHGHEVAVKYFRSERMAWQWAADYGKTLALARIDVYGDVSH